MDREWLEVLGNMTYGIYVLTTYHDRIINGMIASWVSQVSHDPAMVMVAVHPNRYSHQLIQKSDSFALHILQRNQRNLLDRFKGRDPEGKFTSLQWTKGKTGCPILKECLGYMECMVSASYTPGNHALFIGEIVDAKTFSREYPLSTLDYEGVYIGKD